MILQVGFPFLSNIFSTVVGTKNNEFSTGSVFDFRVPDFESRGGFAFISKVIHP